MTPSDVVRVDDLPREICAATAARRRRAAASDGGRPPQPATRLQRARRRGTLREFKDAPSAPILVQKLRENNWNISKTAEVIDTPRSNLYKKLEQYGIKQEMDG